MKIRAGSVTTLTLNETDIVKSVVQNIATIINTWRGTVPLDREFGVSRECLHKPLSVAMLMMYADIQETIEKYEPRCIVENVSFETDPNDPEKTIPIVEVTITDEQE